jgi:hypothetical protein
MRKYKVYVFILIAAVGLMWLVLAGCEFIGPEQLSFEVIDQGENFWNGTRDEADEPDFLVIASAEEIDSPEFGIEFPPGLADTLRQVDYGESFVIIALRGQLHSTSDESTIDVQEIGRADSEVVIQASLGHPDVGSVIQMAYSSLLGFGRFKQGSGRTKAGLSWRSMGRRWQPTGIIFPERSQGR